jgi:hypothetical protein
MRIKKFNEDITDLDETRVSKWPLPVYSLDEKKEMEQYFTNCFVELQDDGYLTKVIFYYLYGHASVLIDINFRNHCGYNIGEGVFKHTLVSKIKMLSDIEEGIDKVKIKYPNVSLVIDVVENGNDVEDGYSYENVDMCVEIKDFKKI